MKTCCTAVPWDFLEGRVTVYVMTEVWYVGWKYNVDGAGARRGDRKTGTAPVDSALVFVLYWTRQPPYMMLRRYAGTMHVLVLLLYLGTASSGYRRTSIAVYCDHSSCYLRYLGTGIASGGGSSRI